jgi:hypothetical protein
MITGQISLQQLIDRCIRSYYGGDYASEESVLTNNFVQLHINDAIAMAISKSMQENYVVTGIQSVSEGFLSTFTITSFTKNADTGFYVASLPHPPIGTPENSSVSGVYFGGVKGQSKPVLEVKANEVDYFRFMPIPPQAAFYWMEGGSIYLWLRTNLPSNAKLFIRMATNLSTNADAPLNMPPDAVDFVYNYVMDKLYKNKSVQGDSALDGKDK